jgi:predicted transcriptional regulator
MKYRNPYFPVVKNEEIIGIITINDLKSIPLERRSSLRIEEVMGSISKFPSVDEDQTVKDAYQGLQQQQREPRFVLVQKGDKITGFIGPTEIQSTLRLSELLLGETTN